MDKKHFSKTTEVKKVTTFPKFLADGEKAKSKMGLGSLDDTGVMRPPRQSINQIIGDAKLPAGSNVKKTLEASIAKSKSLTGNDLFDVDHKTLGDFALPGKPEAKTIIPASTRSRMSKAKAAKAVDTEDAAPEPSTEHEYRFLPQAMILDTPQKYLVPSTDETTNHNRDTNQSSSDLDKIASIMESIKTGDDAINFFARFGAESPVSAIALSSLRCLVANNYHTIIFFYSGEIRTSICRE